MSFSAKPTSKMIPALLIGLTVLPSLGLAADKTTDKSAKGLLPEVAIGGTESENEKKAFTSEMLITRAENKALESLQALLKKKKGTAEEPYLQYRLAELYMKRSKSGRFFDMQRNSKSAFPVPTESSAEHIRKAVQIYNHLAQKYPKFEDMDSVLFNNAFANQQLGLANMSIHLYRELIARFPNSNLIPDARLAAGELLYNQQNFAAAIEHFSALESFPNARVYSYGMYKAAWTHYNLRNNQEAVKRMIQVVRQNPPLEPGQTLSNKHHLRKEALRDLCVFIGESYTPQEIYPFFEKMTTSEELAQAMLDMGKIYSSYSKHKEMSVFLNDYLEDQEYGSAAVKAHMLMVDAQEHLKARENVLQHLQAASQLCAKDSRWIKANKPEEVVESCQERFRRDSLEIASKWWDIWLKNKTHKEFSSLTERAFALILQNDDPKNPDVKTRYAYAELLFQQNKFLEAANQYQMVAANDSALKHDADYGVLFSYEKAIETDSKNQELQKKRFEAATNYVKNHPTGSYNSAVRFKIALLNYEAQKYQESSVQLSSLIAQNPTPDIKTKAQDLLLDILNIQKNYAGIRDLSEKIAREKGVSSERSSQLKKISQEAHFADIQVLADSGKTAQALAELQNFIEKNKDSELAEKAHLQILAIELKIEKDLAAAKTAMLFAEKYPKNTQSVAALKEASLIYTQSGQFPLALTALQKLVKADEKNKTEYQKKMMDLTILENDYAQVKAILEPMTNSPQRPQMVDALLKLQKMALAAKDEKTLQNLENKILQNSVEPQATGIVIKKAETAFNAKNYSLAFDLSLKANSRSSSQEARAPARILQAKILEMEHRNQSVKTKLDRLPLVLGMKTEKFDKAHTAYFSAAKMATDPKVKAQAMEGLDRIYRDFVSALDNIAITDPLTPEDQQALKAELAKISGPMNERRIENEAQLKVLRESAGLVATSPTSGLLANETMAPTPQYPAAKAILPLLPEAKWNDLLKAKKADALEKEALALFESKETKALSLVMLSIAAEFRQQYEKALWLAEQSLNEKKSYEYAHFQRGRIVYLIDNNIQNALGDFEKSEALKKSSSVLASIFGIKAFTSGKYDEAIKNFSFAKKEDAINLELGSMISEALAKKGESEKALSVIKEYTQADNNNVRLLLQEAHILETYKASPATALNAYSKALKASKDQELNNWLEAKIKYLKTVVTEAM